MLLHAVRYKFINVSEVFAASIIMAVGDDESSKCL
jgi:hypothetical protein